MSAVPTGPRPGQEAEWKEDVRRRYRFRKRKADAIIARFDRQAADEIWIRELVEEHALRRAIGDPRPAWLGERLSKGAQRPDELLGHARPLDELRVARPRVLQEGIEARCACGRVLRITAGEPVDDAEQVAHLLE